MNCFIGREGSRGGFRIHVMKGCCEGDAAEEGAAEAGESCCGGGFGRRFKTKEEKIAGLEEYLKDLEAETAAVREAIADLKPA